ncbi:MAG: hypothetical protein P4L55_04595, partial [Syntrophobacteraceae bacterium]|nr:hypothetical protein [Syntrophobacteraceae bacterium]
GYALGEDEATNHWSPEWDPNKLALMGHAPRTFVLCLALSGQLRHSLERNPSGKIFNVTWYQNAGKMED